MLEYFFVKILGACPPGTACSANIRLASPYRAETSKLASLQKRRPNWTSLQPAVASVGRLLGCARFVTIQKRRPGRTSQHIVTNGSAAAHTAAPAGAKIILLLSCSEYVRLLWDGRFCREVLRLFCQQRPFLQLLRRILCIVRRGKVFRLLFCMLRAVLL